MTCAWRTRKCGGGGGGGPGRGRCGGDRRGGRGGGASPWGGRLLAGPGAARGAAMGGGAGLLAACDFVIAADDLRLAYPEVRRGLVAALVTCLLRRQLPERLVRELILLGRTLSAAQALAAGLVREVAMA